MLYTGTGSSNAVTGVGFSPDLTWIKNRDTADDNIYVDAVRVPTNYLVTNTDGVEVYNDNYVASLDSDGFTVGTGTETNTSTENYVSWNWLAAAANAANGDGSVSSVVRANTTAGFSIVSYTGTGSAATIGHGLSQAPELVIVKNRTSASQEWVIGADALTSWVYSMELNTTGGEGSEASRFNSTAPSATVFSIGTSSYTNENTSDMIAYCFHSIEGYSKVGKYIGNNTSAGVFIYTGFRPAFFMIKAIGRGSDWYIIDNKRIGYNASNYRLQPNQNRAEATTIWADFDSNGVKLRTADTDWNPTDSEGVLFYAISEFPFKYANAR